MLSSSLPDLSPQAPTPGPAIVGPFSPDQKQYLEGFFAGAQQRMPFVGLTASGHITADATTGAENAATPAC